MAIVRQYVLLKVQTLMKATRLLTNTTHCHHKMFPFSVKETPHHYLVRISKESLKGQNKFLIQFDEKG